jgi:hypothetical protein
MLSALTYFFPKALTLEAGAPAGLLGLLRSGPLTHSQNTALGPEGRGILAVRGQCAPVYDAAGQRWVKVAAAGYWVGFRQGLRPAELARPVQLPGALVRLADGQDWLIPYANPCFPSCGLPYVQVRDVTGVWQREIKAEYAELSELALDWSGRLRRALLERSALEFEEAELLRAFCRILAVNYALTLDEIEALRLLEPVTYLPVLEAFTDFASQRALLAACLREAEETRQNPTEGTPGGSGIASGVPD